MGWSMAVTRVAVMVGLAAFAAVRSAPAHAQYLDDAPTVLPLAPTGAESAANSLARNVRILVQEPRNYSALLGAGRAALSTGDPEAAVGFFGRAADVSPKASAPRAGLASALVAMGEARRALDEFEAAERLGASRGSLAIDRGLARDLLGQQSLAQAEYRAALAGPDGAEARRRLALSLAISGDRIGALAALAPLLQRADVPTNRVRAFILAIDGDAAGAGRALDRSMPGMSISLDPFFRRLPGLSSAQKAAAVHLGIFPGNGAVASGPALATISSNLPPPATPIEGGALSRSGSNLGFGAETENNNRLAGIDALLSGSDTLPSRKTSSLAAPPAPEPHYETAAIPLPPRVAPLAGASNTTAPSRIWVQLASGPDEGALGVQFARIAGKSPDLFRSIRPFVSQVNGKTKLLIGPFKNSDDSATFVENLGDAHISGFSWTSPAGQLVRKLATP